MSADGGREMVEVTRADWEAMHRRMERLERAAGVSADEPTTSAAFYQ